MMQGGMVVSAIEAKSHRGSSSHMVSVQRRRSQTLTYKMPKSRFWQRIITLLAANISLYMSIQVTMQMFESVTGLERLVHTYTLDDSTTMSQWIGTSTIRQSPLVKYALDGHTDSLNQTLYLGLDGRASLEHCEQLGTRQQEIYSDGWQRLLFSEAVVGTAYNFTFLSDIELIAPAVDCGSVFITTNDSTRGKFYFLTRAKADLQDIYLLTLSMAIQDFWITSETRVGSAAVASFTLINDLQSDHVDHHFVASLGYPFYSLNFSACELLDDGEHDHLLELRTVPRNRSRELTQLVQTAYRSGFYLTSETARFNIRQQVWLLENSPLSAITRWRWKSKNRSRNMWAWVHLFEPIFAIYVSGHIVLASLIVYQAFQERNLWASDASVAMAKPTQLRGILIALLWCFTSFWDLTEFCLQDAHEIAGVDRIFSFTSVMRYDFLLITGSWASFVAHAAKERIDPGLGFVATLLIFTFRKNIIESSPLLVKSIKELTFEIGEQELRSSPLSPMLLRTPYAIEQYPVKLMLYVLSPLSIVTIVIVAFVIARKIHRHFHPQMRGSQQSYTPSQNPQSLGEGQPLVKSAFTNFELATGSQLETMYGLITDFDNIIIIKGMKFASADGVFGAGFVIINNIMLVQVNDIWHILLMKLIRVRHTNVYMFLLSGTTVRQTALIAYPETMTMRDLLHISVTTLS